MPVSFIAPLLALALVACGGGGGNGPPAPTPGPTATPQGSGAVEQALGRYVDTTLAKPFLEDCTKADAQRDGGKICAAFRGERGNLRAYVLGATFSEGNQWAILEQRNGQWTVVYSQQLTADNAGVPGIPWPLAPGADVIIAGADPCLNVREGPSLTQKAVDCIKNGTKIKVASGPAAGDGIQWWQVAGRSGWVAADYLRYTDAAQ